MCVLVCSMVAVLCCPLEDTPWARKQENEGWGPRRRSHERPAPPPGLSRVSPAVDAPSLPGMAENQTGMGRHRRGAGWAGASWPWPGSIAEGLGHFGVAPGGPVSGPTTREPRAEWVC